MLHSKVIVSDVAEVNWDKSIRSKSKLISLFRQFVANEYDGSRLYSHVESMEDVSIDYLLNKIEELGSTEEKDSFNEILANASNWLPYASSIHNFLRKHDEKWYFSQPALTR